MRIIVSLFIGLWGECFVCSFVVVIVAVERCNGSRYFVGFIKMILFSVCSVPNDDLKW